MLSAFHGWPVRFSGRGLAMTRFPSLMTQLRRGKTAAACSADAGDAGVGLREAHRRASRADQRHYPSRSRRKPYPLPDPTQQLPAPPANPNPQPMPEPVPSRRVAPAELESRIHETWRAFPGRTGIAVQRIDGDWMTGKRQEQSSSPSRAYPKCGCAAGDRWTRSIRDSCSLTTPDA
jgi:hypothetical protein